MSGFPNIAVAPMSVSITRDGSQRRQIERKLLKIADEERRRIGQDLHDDLGQELAGLAFMSDTLVTALRAQASPEVKLAEAVKAGIQRLLSQVRTEAWGLIPVEIEPREFIAALSGLAMQISERFGVECRFHCEEPFAVKRSVTATNLYRIAQESVTNAIKHGHARHISIGLSRNQGEITLRIQDDGTGLPAETSASPGLGLQIMRYRAGLMNATLEIQKLDGSGVRVTCKVNEKDR